MGVSWISLRPEYQASLSWHNRKAMSKEPVFLGRRLLRYGLYGLTAKGRAGVVAFERMATAWLKKGLTIWLLSLPLPVPLRYVGCCQGDPR